MLAATLPYIPLSAALLNKGLNAVLGLVVSLALRSFCARIQARDGELSRAVVLVPVVCYALGIVWSVLWSSILLTAQGTSPFAVPALRLFDYSVTHALALFTWATLYLACRQFLASQEARERLLRSEAMARQAELKALRYQLNPHFLFNSLNTIAALVLERDNESAHAMIVRLSSFLRVTLDGVDEECTLREEAQFVEHYLGIETVRFSDRLKYVLDIDANVLDCRVPHLILQPLVENAIRHGLDRSDRGGTIRVTGRQVNGNLELAVIDDGSGIHGAEPIYGVGLSNVEERLNAQYGGKASLRLCANREGGTTARLRIPEESICAR